MFEKIRDLVAEQLGVNKDDIKPESRFKEDLNADSLDLFELIMSLEEEYSTEIPTDELENLTTIQSVIDYLGAKVYIQNLLYILCFIKILFSLFFYEYEPSFMKDMAFTLPLLLALIVIPIIKKNIK